MVILQGGRRRTNSFPASDKEKKHIGVHRAALSIWPFSTWTTTSRTVLLRLLRRLLSLESPLRSFSTLQLCDRYTKGHFQTKDTMSFRLQCFTVSKFNLAHLIMLDISGSPLILNTFGNNGFSRIKKTSVLMQTHTGHVPSLFTINTVPLHLRLDFCSHNIKEVASK